jgi:ABC-type branched-subunit amino acid transport system permease subunit
MSGEIIGKKNRKLASINILKWLSIIALLIFVIVFPFFVKSAYTKHVAILALSYITLGLSYDLVTGRVGSLSLAHVAFFGIGAYTSALLGIHLGPSAIPRLFFSVFMAIILALIIGIPSFRLSYHSFAMGTLGFSMIMLLVINNWVEFTRGPLCLFAIPRLEFRFPIGQSWTPVSINDYYFVELFLAIGTIFIIQKIDRGRLGRSMLAIREDSTLAETCGIPILKYKMFAFILGGSLASLAGAIFSSYTTVTCPSEFAFYYTVNLLIIEFLGGRASIPGIVLAAILFTSVPELLRLAEKWRLIIYGMLVIVTVLYFPDGISRILKRLSNIISHEQIIIEEGKTASRVAGKINKQ